MITVYPDIYRVTEGVRVPMRALRDRVKSPRTYASKAKVPRFSTGLYEANRRGRSTFIAEGHVATDIGDYPGGATRDEIEGAFSGLRGVAYSSWSSTIEEPRFRVILELSRLADADEHDRLWRAIADIEERAGLKPDHSSKGAPHPWALPARHDGDHYKHFDLDGAPLDVEAALARFPQPVPLEPAQRERGTDTYERRLDRASRYLEKMPGAISGSKGHATTFAAAVAMVRGFALEPDDALRLLVEIHNPMCAPAWSERELVHKIKQAYQRARVPFGAIAERRRDGRAA